MTKVTILGAGAMGFRMAKKLLGAGYPVTVFNRTEKHVLPLIDSGAVFPLCQASCLLYIWLFRKTCGACRFFFPLEICPGGIPSPTARGESLNLHLIR